MLAVYLAVVGLVQGWAQAVQLLRQDGYLVVPLAAAFGSQIGLYAYLRVGPRVKSRSGRAMTGAGGATSTVSMVACCAHRVAELLPFLGLTAAAGFLAASGQTFTLLLQGVGGRNDLRFEWTTATAGGVL